ncbi:MAG: nucleotidyltransferase family protein [Bacillota bacterium]
MSIRGGCMPVYSELKDKREMIMNTALRFGVNKVKIFGSVARGEETSNSDIDLLVNCDEKCSLFDLISLKNELEEILGRKVDIVTEESIHWYIRDKVIQEAIEI